MKKILFGFGTIGAVVAPVAAVVACDKDTPAKDTDKTNTGTKGTPTTAQTAKEETLLIAKNTKITTIDQVKNILKEAKYGLSDADTTTLFNAIKDTTVVATHDGKLGDASHGTNDFVILLKGTENTAPTKTTSMRAFNVGAISTATNTDPVVVGGTAETLATKWGITETEYNNSTLTVFIQSEPNATIVSYAKLVKVAADNKLYHDESTSQELKATLTA